MKSFSRREFIAASAATGVMALAGSRVVSAETPPRDAEPLVFAHLSDMHIRPTGAGPAGLARCLAHVHAHPAKPKFILNGGDIVMSLLGATEESAKGQWEALHAVLNEHNKLPMYHMLGNHDCWGWQRTRAGTTGDEPKYGKVWAQEELKLDELYYSFDDGGWRFIVLDSVQERGGEAYMPRLDDEQFDWLVETLDSTPAETPVIIASHVPILGVAPMFFYDDIVENYQFRVAGALMHQDVKRIAHMLRNYDNVKLCISGHVHIVDHVEFEGKVYLNNGAVSGSWWNGPHQNCPPGYALMKLWPSGAYEREYIVYDNEVG